VVSAALQRVGLAGDREVNRVEVGRVAAAGSHAVFMRGEDGIGSLAVCCDEVAIVLTTGRTRDHFCGVHPGRRSASSAKLIIFYVLVQAIEILAGSPDNRKAR